MTTLLPMYTYDPTIAALTTEFSPTNTWSPIYRGKKATLQWKQVLIVEIDTFTVNILAANSANTYPLLNFLKDGRRTALLLTMQYLPVRTLARSPRIMASD